MRPASWSSASALLFSLPHPQHSHSTSTLNLNSDSTHAHIHCGSAEPLACALLSSPHSKLTREAIRSRAPTTPPRPQPHRLLSSLSTPQDSCSTRVFHVWLASWMWLRSLCSNAVHSNRKYTRQPSSLRLASVASPTVECSSRVVRNRFSVVVCSSCWLMPAFDD
jgi:hypothetical protein